MRLAVTILSSALVAGRAQDLTFEVTLTNDGARPVITCAKDAPFAPLYELPQWRVQLARAGGRADGGAHPVTSVRSLFDPRLGAPSPPYVPRYLKEHGAPLKPGASLIQRIHACWLPRAVLPDEPRLRRLVNHPVAPPAPLPPGQSWNPGDYTRASILVIGDECAALTKAIAGGSDDILFGRPIAILSQPGSYDVTFGYHEKEAHGFVPAQPIDLTAPPLRVDIP